MEFAVHHLSISVRDIDATVGFYREFGFEPVFEMHDVDLSIVHLRHGDGVLLEVFRYPHNAEAAPEGLEPGNAMDRVGVKHLALEVADVRGTRERLAGEGHRVTAVSRGRARLDYCFVADPDGMWVELVQPEGA